jgi:protein farnesyltransferase/geranylgeranyltransferase type-1 subunit alpha
MAAARDTPGSSSSDEDVDFIDYENRPEWADLKPIYLTDSETRLINIAYSDQFRSAYAYLRACLQVDERSERAFALTNDCIRLNPANYTVWYYRRVLLDDLNKSIEEEITFLGKCQCLWM